MLLRSSIMLFALAAALCGQWAGSGSTGADGELILTEPGTVIFDPRTFNPPLNPSGNNIYQFTSIYIGGGVTVKLSSSMLNGPVFWLAQGPVEIDGAIDLSAGDGDHASALAGTGGYPGGLPGSPGYGPIGFVPNVFLVPLVGGLGGYGGLTTRGGGGGGALLIASSASINVNGAITANGGPSSDGSGGGGGAIRLVAPAIAGSGSLSAKGGQIGGADGIIRFETFGSQFSGSLNNTPFAQGKPFGLFLPPDTASSVRIVSIDGRASKNSEFTVERSSAVRVIVEARHVPPGTVVELQLSPENGPGQTVSTAPLVGTLELSRATATVTLPRGSLHAIAKAAWKQP
jgi:hypothetical protein